MPITVINKENVYDDNIYSASHEKFDKNNEYFNQMDMNDELNESLLSEEEIKELSIYSEKVTKGLQDFRDAHKDQRNTDIIRCVKRVIFGDKKGIEKENLEMLVLTFRKIIEICNVTPAEYNRFWNTQNNKKMFLENLGRKITNMASDEDKEECAFQRKRLLFKIVFPEYYKEAFSDIKPSDIFWVNGKDKADLVRAAKPLTNKEDKEDGKTISDGAIVDKIIMKAINDVFNDCFKDEEDMTLLIMKTLSKNKILRETAKSFSNSKNTLPGCFSVINERKCYESYLDFYFLNLPQETQLAYVHDYMEIRESAKLPKNPFLDKLYEVVKSQEQLCWDYLD